ncbi:metal ABC transporter substrate-binding protein [Caproiciproducens galactitolivorans]|uniref:Metal ABC transporter substrate-binding protein n=1 Tax=Caproiciproducens galactitolivorans TaxID=642589 RepID=A0ABT4BU11_9FIRM|nr:metal ABC transporter substrate-binding protein [Caproiciproducens galactitolivorans]MCY1714392.1 metal ABC transporter substrate-binding protein [Caproiciproducens galactitolivorans]
MKRLTAVLLATVILFCTAGCAHRTEQPARFRVVTSFYPLYIMALNITDGVSGVQVDNMAGQQTGCLHDYQLQSQDMKNIEQADVFVINGAGMESFMNKVTSQLPKLRVINSSDGIPLLKDQTGEANPHIWVSITNAIRQVTNIAEGLAEADPANAAAYRKNAEEYVAKLSILRKKMHEELSGISNRDIITFHEAFPYFAEEFGLNIVKVVNREPDSQPSARELAQTIKLVRGSGIKTIFAEPQYPKSAANIIAKESGAAVYSLDPAVTGENRKDAYLTAMENNLTVLKQALK